MVGTLFLYSAMYLQIIAGGGHRAIMTGGGGCSISGTFTDCFPYTENPINNGSKWTAAASTCSSGFHGVEASGTGAFPIAEPGCAVLTGFTNSTPVNRFKMDDGSDSGISGVCLWANTTGDGYCYLINYAQMFKITAGAGSPIGSSDCPSGGGGGSHDVFQISVNGSNLLTCTDVTLGTSGTTVTDSTFTVTMGGFIVDHGRKVIAYGWL